MAPNINTIYQKITVVLLFGLLLFFAFNRHSKTGILAPKSEIWADKAGYYVYLPASFIYQFDASLFPNKIDELTGKGFRLDSLTGKVYTKYNYGVALMQLPFFVGAHIMATLTHHEANGFSEIYHWAIDFAAVFYLMLGLFLLWKFLGSLFNNKISSIAILFLLLGTNLLYYGTIETGMSHVYSFSLVSILLYLLAKPIDQKTKILPYGALIGAISGLILVIRPINILLIAFVFLISIINKKGGKELFSKIRFILPFVVLATIIFIPQLFYWKYLTGSWIIDSYKGESFSNLKSPLLLEYLFAPNNGMLLYNPLLFVVIGGILFMIWKKQKKGMLIGLLLVVATYLYSSWWIYSFGCGYGSRNMVEYLPVLAIPFAYLLISTKNKPTQILIYSVSILFTVYNLKMIMSYGWCWFGHGNWDWNEYLHWLIRSTH